MLTITDMRQQIAKYWSQSRVGLYRLCSLKYAFSYVYRVEAEFTPLALVLGSATHRTLEAISYARKDGTPISESECRELFAEIWRRQLQEDKDIRYGEGQDAETCLTQGQDLIGVFHANTDPEEEVLGVSEAMAVPLVNSEGGVLDDPLIGELDLLVRDRDGRKVIVDWKTAARRWAKGKAHGEIQPTAMIYSYLQQHGELLEFRYDIGLKTRSGSGGFQQESTTRGPDDFDRMVWIIQGIEKAIKADAFLPQPGFMCSSCQYSRRCAEAHRLAARVTVRMAA